MKSPNSDVGLTKPTQTEWSKKKNLVKALRSNATHDRAVSTEKWGCGGTSGVEMAQEPGAGEHLKAEAVFSPAPPEHQGVHHGQESARRAAAAWTSAAITADLVWKSTKKTNTKDKSSKKKKQLLMLRAIWEELEKLCANVVTTHSWPNPHPLSPCAPSSACVFHPDTHFLSLHNLQT